MRRLDTNVLVRYLVQDDAKQAALATRYVERHCTTESPGFINHIVLCELAWVLEGSYQQSRSEIASIVEQLLQVSQLEVMEPDIAWRALNDYRNSNADFPDHLMARINEAKGCETTLTFDKKAARHPAFQLLK